jgi:hypothetical protein
MSVKNINKLVDNISQTIIDKMLLKEKMQILHDNNGNILNNLNYPSNYFYLYGFVLAKNNLFGISYIGKDENNNRLRQHITGQNKDGTPLKVSTKHQNIKKAINDGYQVWLILYESNDFNKASLSCIEIACIEKSIAQLKSIFPNEQTWNQRI